MRSGKRTAPSSSSASTGSAPAACIEQDGASTAAFNLTPFPGASTAHPAIYRHTNVRAARAALIDLREELSNVDHGEANSTREQTVARIEQQLALAKEGIAKQARRAKEDITELHAKIRTRGTVMIAVAVACGAYAVMAMRSLKEGETAGLEFIISLRGAATLGLFGLLGQISRNTPKAPRSHPTGRTSSTTRRRRGAWRALSPAPHPRRRRALPLADVSPVTDTRTFRRRACVRGAPGANVPRCAR